MLRTKVEYLESERELLKSEKELLERDKQQLSNQIAYNTRDESFLPEFEKAKTQILAL